MILPTIALIVLAVVVLAFVLEPVLRARPDAVVLDAAALPRALPEITDEGKDDPAAADVHDEPAARRPPGVPTSIEPRPAGDPT